MAKSIKRVVMIFFVLVISCLIALGCINALQVADDSSKTISTNAGNNITTEVNSDSYYNSDITQNKATTNYNIPSAESEYVLNCNCPAGAPCTCGKLEDIWSNAVHESLDTGKNVKVTLGRDWIAKEDETDTAFKIFGSSFAFNNGRIAIVYGSEITLDLNGHSIDRNFEQVASSTNGSVIIVMGGTLNLYDSKYNESAILKCYEDNKEDESTLVEKLKSLQVGNITGGWTPGNGGGILVYTANGYTSKFNMYNGLIIGNQANYGGGIYAYPNTTINIYDGIIACNKSINGGAVYLNHAICDIYRVNIMNNTVTSQAGGIYVTNYTHLTIDNFDIYDNTAVSGGAMYIFSNSVVDIYSGKIHHNSISKSQNSLAIGCSSNSLLNIYDADIYENQGSYGTLFVVGLATINLYGGKIHDNHADNSGAIDCNNGYFNMYGGEAYNNNITTSGSFMYLLGGNGEAKIYGGKIYNNHTASTNNGAIYINSTAQLWIGAGAQIYGNTAGTDNHAANVFLFSNQKINVLERLINSKENAHVGVTLYNYSDDTFTEKYSVYNSDVNPALYFFMSNSTQGLKILDGEVAVDDTITKPNQMVEWYWNSTQKTTSTNVTLPYIGSNYVIKSSLGSFWSALEQKTVTEYEIKNVGTYSFCVSNANASHAINYINPVFNVTITPKVVDIEWNNSLTYNGYPQSPTAVVKQGSLLNSDTCTVSVSGSAQNVGTGYVAKATGLSNSNYKINPETNSTFYSINPAELEINIITNNKNVKYNGQSVELNDWLNITHNAAGLEKYKSIDSIFDIDYSKIIPQFTKDSLTSDSAVNVGEYAISVKPFNVNEVFSGNNNYNVVINYVNGGTLSITESQVIRPSVDSQYEYLVLEDDKRVAYSEKELVHGENDSNVNMSNGKANYYLGNIAPNTSVNKFISNLVYDKTQIQIYNNKDEIIYNKGNAEVNAELLDNGIELAIGTGWYVEYVVGSTTERITLSVLGDINGDGRISAKDVATLREIANNKAVYESLSVEQKLASMIVNKGGVTTADAEIVRNVIDKLFDINLFF